jgi:hypothetical protein
VPGRQPLRHFANKFVNPVQVVVFDVVEPGSGENIVHELFIPALGV